MPRWGSFEAGPAILLTAKSCTWRGVRSTRTTLNPTGVEVRVVTGARSPKSATKPWPTNPNRSSRRDVQTVGTGVGVERDDGLGWVGLGMLGQQRLAPSTISSRSS